MVHVALHACRQGRWLSIWSQELLDNLDVDQLHPETINNLRAIVACLDVVAQIARHPTVITTLPIFCPVSTYRYASTIWSSEYLLSMRGLKSPDSISPFTYRIISWSCCGIGNTTFFPPESFPPESVVMSARNGFWEAGSPEVSVGHSRPGRADGRLPRLSMDTAASSSSTPAVHQQS